MNDLPTLLKEIEPVISAVVGLLTLCAAVWGGLELAIFSRRRRRRRAAREAALRSAPGGFYRAPWTSLLNLGVGRHSRLEELVSVRAVNIAFACIGGIALPWVFISFVTPGARLLSAINLFVVVAALLGFALQSGGSTGISRWLALMAGSIYWLGALLAAGPMQGTEYFIVALLSIPVLIFSRAQQAQMFLAVVGILAVFAVGVVLSRALPPLLDLPPGVLAVGYLLNAVLLAVAIVFAVAFYRRFAASSYQELEFQKQENERLAANFLPPRLLKMLGGQREQSTFAEWHPEATVLFTALTGFSSLYTRIPATELVEKLSQIFVRFDALLARHGLEKIKTLGTAYVAATGVGGHLDHGAVAACALEMRQTVLEYLGEEGLQLEFYAGIATGVAISGVMADAHPRFDVWGEALEGAILMRELAPANAICVNEVARWRLGSGYRLSALHGHECTFVLEG